VKIIVLVVIFFSALGVSAEAAKVSFGQCVVSLPEEFIENEGSGYFYSPGAGFKSVSLSDSENPKSFFEKSEEVKRIEVYRAENFYVFYYQLWSDPKIKDDAVLVDFILLWRSDKILSFSGFDIASVKALINSSCADNWVLIDSSKFFSELSE